MENITLGDNSWENFDVITPNTKVINKVENFLNTFNEKCQVSEDTWDVFPNTNGDITIECRSARNFVSIEFGTASNTCYSIINGEIRINKDFKPKKDFHKVVYLLKKFNNTMYEEPEIRPARKFKSPCRRSKIAFNQYIKERL